MDIVSSINFMFKKFSLWMPQGHKRETIDKNLSVEERTKKHGYTFTTHEVTTDDGYILSLY